MKKFTKFELIGIGISLLLICIIISLIGKYVFELQGDYLSAASTLFAAVIAALLYSDWKIQHKIQLLDKYHNEFKKLCSNLQESQKQIGNEYVLFLGSTHKTISIDSDLRKYKVKLKGEFNALNSLLNEYDIYLNTLGGERFILEHKSLGIEMRKNLLEASEELSTINNTKQKDHLTPLIDSLYTGLIFNFINSYQKFSDVDNPKFYFEFFNIQN